MTPSQRQQHELAPKAGNSQGQAVVAVDPMQLLSMAVAQGADIDKLEKLMALQERWEANNARKEFDNAIAAAKSEIKPIVKKREVVFVCETDRAPGDAAWPERGSFTARGVQCKRRACPLAAGR